jgi:hypothetical protein
MPVSRLRFNSTKLSGGTGVKGFIVVALKTVLTSPGRPAEKRRYSPAEVLKSCIGGELKSGGYALEEDDLTSPAYSLTTLRTSLPSRSRTNFECRRRSASV